MGEREIKLKAVLNMDIKEFIFTIKKDNGKNELRFVPPSIIVVNEHKMYNIIKKHERKWVKLLKKAEYRIKFLSKGTCKKIRGLKGSVVSLSYVLEEF